MAEINRLYLNQLNTPIVTGHPLPRTVQTDTADTSPSFQEVLREKLAAQTQVTFSKHAANRAEQRGIDLSDQNLERLNEGVRMAREKGLGDTLILVDSTAFIVNARSSKVITTVDASELRGNVFTNLDGTVVI